MKNYFILIVLSSIVLSPVFFQCTRSTSNHQRVVSPKVAILPMRLMEPISMAKPISIAGPISDNE